MENWWYHWQLAKIKVNEISEDVVRERLIQQYKKRSRKRLRDQGAKLLCRLGGLFIRAGTCLRQYSVNKTPIGKRLRNTIP